MSHPRPGASGALNGVLALILAVLLGLTAIVLAAPGRAAGGEGGGPGGAGRAGPPAVLARLALPPLGRGPVDPTGPEPGGPDTPGLTSLVSAWTPAAGSPAAPSIEPAVSGDGRYVAYASTATTIVSGVGIGTSHIYEYDRTTGLTSLVSSPTILVGGQPELVARTAQAIEPSVDTDGGVVAYVLVTPPVVGAVLVAGTSLVVVHDNGTGADTELAAGSRPSISGNGRYVAFETTAALDPVHDTNKVADIYVLDRTTNVARLASAGPSGHALSAPSTDPSLSADASSVAFTSAAPLLSADHDPAGDIYVRRLTTNVTILVSVHAGADTGASSSASISATGRFVAFSSQASTLAAGPRAGGGADADVYLRDVTLKHTQRLSVANGGGPADGSSNGPAISADGRTVAFSSGADDLVPADTNSAPDVFIVASSGGRISRASISTAGAQAGAASTAPAISADGSILAFQSSASNLAPGSHGSIDVYLRVRQPKAVLSPPVLSFAARPAGSTSPPATVTVTNAGAAPLGIASVALAGLDPGAFAIAGDACTGASLLHGQACGISVSFTPPVPGSVVASLVVTDNDATGSQTVPLDGGTLAPTIVVNPAIGPAGFVTSAIGTNFPPGATVVLTWSVGLTATMPPVVADASGSFLVQVLILPRDILGPRILDGTFTAAGGGSAQSQPFLVVPGTGQPPFGDPRVPGQLPEQIFRR